MLFELSPVIMAIVAIVASGRAYQYARPGRDRVIVLMSIVASALLIMAQTALFISTFVTNKPETTFSYLTWAVFNNLTMLMILLYVVPRSKNKDEFLLTK